MASLQPCVLQTPAVHVNVLFLRCTYSNITTHYKHIIYFIHARTRDTCLCFLRSRFCAWRTCIGAVDCTLVRYVEFQCCSSHQIWVWHRDSSLSQLLLVVSDVPFLPPLAKTIKHVLRVRTGNPKSKAIEADPLVVISSSFQRQAPWWCGNCFSWLLALHMYQQLLDLELNWFSDLRQAIRIKLCILWVTGWWQVMTGQQWLWIHVVLKLLKVKVHLLSTDTTAGLLRGSRETQLLKLQESTWL